LLVTKYPISKRTTLIIKAKFNEDIVKYMFS
jgi:hypothetical protein